MARRESVQLGNQQTRPLDQSLTSANRSSKPNPQSLSPHTNRWKTIPHHSVPIAPAITFPPLSMSGMIGIVEPTNVDARTTKKLCRASSFLTGDIFSPYDIIKSSIAFEFAAIRRAPSSSSFPLNPNPIRTRASKKSWKRSDHNPRLRFDKRHDDHDSETFGGTVRS
ncbi:MAG TPA: hypothetical protein VE862_03065 [Candidatus Acidoferrum sp.]|nr:hypothetical protein [Candidatus Acidoferrum sp.]